VLDQGWDRDALLAAAQSIRGLVLQAPSEQRRHKLSLEIRPGAERSCAEFGEAVAELRLALDATRVPHELIVSSGCDVDILPRGANKGAALAQLL
jgi:hydroxymethylpyrimidine pyrophosphatase-like HAD family hydrolase